jgi:hypothetical protein
MTTNNIHSLAVSNINSMTTNNIHSLAVSNINSMTTNNIHSLAGSNINSMTTNNIHSLAVKNIHINCILLFNKISHPFTPERSIMANAFGFHLFFILEKLVFDKFHWLIYYQNENEWNITVSVINQ